MIKKIIEELADSTNSLGNPLLKVKVFATRLGNTELLFWINNELNGYAGVDEEKIPKYRIAKANSICDINYGYLYQQKQLRTPVPVLLIGDEKFQRFFLNFPFLEGVQTLESYLNNKENDIFAKEFGADIAAIATNEIKKNGAKLVISNISIRTHVSSVTQILSEIRSKFLDLMLSLEQKFPELVDISKEPPIEKGKISNTITVIMKQINISNSGDGSTINTGKKNEINSASGDNIKQEIIDNESLAALITLISQIKTSINENEFDEKEDILFEVQRIENQLQKAAPQRNIINQSLTAIQGFLGNVVANAWTDPILQGIQILTHSLG